MQRRVLVAEVSCTLPAAPLDTQRRRLLVALIVGLASAAPLPRCAQADVKFAAPDATAWQSVLETLFPHNKVDPALYAIPAGALVAAADKDPARQILLDGWQSLNQAAGGSWATASAAARDRALHGIVGTPLFGILRQTTVFMFYNDPKVWTACGYEGDAWRFGGYAGAHLVTVDWLPTAPL